MQNDPGRTDLNRIGHFHERGANTTRLEAFVDAAFAFALTLLVISFDRVPESYAELVDALRAVPAFLLSFAVVAMFWVAHRNWSRRYGMDTTFSMLVSLAMIFIIMVYVYPLRAMSDGGLPINFEITTLDHVRGLFTIYGIGFVSLNVCLILLNWHALHYAEALDLTPEERFLTVSEILAWCVVGSTGLVSILLALTAPPRLVGWAGWIYASLSVVMGVFGAVQSRRFDARFPRARTT